MSIKIIIASALLWLALLSAASGFAGLRISQRLPDKALRLFSRDGLIALASSLLIAITFVALFLIILTLIITKISKTHGEQVLVIYLASIWFFGFYILMRILIVWPLNLKFSSPKMEENCRLLLSLGYILLGYALYGAATLLL